MMKKTTSALAIAAMLGTGAATAATFQINDDTTFGVSGRVSPYVTNVEEITDPTSLSGSSVNSDSDGDLDNVTGNFADGTDDSVLSATTSSADVNATRGTESNSKFSDTSRVIFSGEHSFNNGLTGIINYQLRQLGNTSNDGKSDSNVEARTAFIGMQGDTFGRLTFGRQAGVYKSAVGSTADVSYFGGPTLPSNGGNNRNLQYSTPSFSGVTLHAGAQLNGDESKADFNDSNESLSAAITFDGPGFTLSAAYDQAKYIGRDAQGTDFLESEAEVTAAGAFSAIQLDEQSVTAYNALDASVRPGTVDLADGEAPADIAANDFAAATVDADVGDYVLFTDAIAADTSEESIMGVALNTSVAGLPVNAWYQVDGSQDENDEIDLLGVSVGYSAGNFSGLAVFQEVDSQVDELNIDGTVDADPESRTEIFLQGVYAMSDQFNVVGEYRTQDRDEDVGDLYSVGAVYNF
jgi:predicted porin